MGCNEYSVEHSAVTVRQNVGAFERVVTYYQGTLTKPW